MTLQKSCSGSVDRSSGPSSSRRFRLRALGAAVALSVGFAAGTAHAAPTQASAAGSGTHVYLLRGVLNIFSLGMDEIAYKLEQQGIKTTVANYLLWESLAADAAAEYKSGKARTIVLVGHSSGATALPDMVARLDQLGAPVTLAIGLDSVFHTSLKGRVGRYLNFYIANGAGTRVEKTKQLRGALDNIDVSAVPGMGHGAIDKLDVMQQKVIGAIDQVAFRRAAPNPAATAARAAAPAAAAAAAPASTASAAATNR